MFNTDGLEEETDAFVEKWLGASGNYTCGLGLAKAARMFAVDHY